jgi:hypothetical protein
VKERDFRQVFFSLATVILASRVPTTFLFAQHVAVRASNTILFLEVALLLAPKQQNGFLRKV